MAACASGESIFDDDAPGSGTGSDSGSGTGSDTGSGTGSDSGSGTGSDEPETCAEARALPTCTQALMDADTDCYGTVTEDCTTAKFDMTGSTCMTMNVKTGDNLGEEVAKFDMTGAQCVSAGSCAMIKGYLPTLDISCAEASRSCAVGYTCPDGNGDTGSGNVEGNTDFPTKEQTKAPTKEPTPAPTSEPTSFPTPAPTTPTVVKVLNQRCFYNIGTASEPQLERTNNICSKKSHAAMNNVYESCNADVASTSCSEKCKKSCF